jgi:hypothetical protein
MGKPGGVAAIRTVCMAKDGRPPPAQNCRNQIHAPGRFADGDEMRPEIAEEQVQRVTCRMGETAEPGCELELPGVAAQQAWSECVEIQQEGAYPDDARDGILGHPQARQLDGGSSV